MLTLLRLMLLEEYRVHMAYSSPRVFFSLPGYVFIIAFFMAATLPVMESSIRISEVLLFANAGVFVYGMSVGAFGFLGKTYLERRQGRANFLVAMPFLLPFSFRSAYVSMFARDVIFYIVLILLPGLFGVLASTPIVHYSFYSIGLAFLAVVLSFLLGISFSFLVSVLYVRSKKAFALVLGAFIAFLLGYGVLHLYPLDLILPSIAFQSALRPLGDDIPRAVLFLVISLVSTALFTFLAVVLVREAPLGNTQKVEESFPRVHARFQFAKSFQSLLAKEYIDLARSGALSKMLLAYVAPLVFLSFTTWYVNHGLAIPVGFNTVFYAAMVGFFGVMLYSWLTNIDAIDYFETLPVSTTKVIKAKLLSFFLLTTFISTGFVLFISFAYNETRLLWVALPVLYVTGAYMVVATAYLTGLSPNSVLFSPSVMTRFMVISLLPDLCITILSFSLDTQPVVALAGIGLVCFTLLTTTLLFIRGLARKWDHAGFS
jgi:MFS family permease